MVVLGVLGLSRGGSALCEGREDQVRPGPGVQQHRGRAGVRQGEPCFVLFGKPAFRYVVKFLRATLKWRCQNFSARADAIFHYLFSSSPGICSAVLFKKICLTLS